MAKKKENDQNGNTTKATEVKATKTRKTPADLANDLGWLECLPSRAEGFGEVSLKSVDLLITQITEADQAIFAAQDQRKGAISVLRSKAKGIEREARQLFGGDVVDQAKAEAALPPIE